MANDVYLIVEDARSVRLFIRDFLERIEVPPENVHEAPDGDQGLELFRQHQPTIVFLDVEMPGLGGEALGLTMLDEAPRTRIALITGLERNDERVSHLIQNGARAYIQKPLTQRAMADFLRLLAEEEGLRRV